MSAVAAPDVMIAPCDPGDGRYGAWVAAAAKALAPDPAERAAGVDALRGLGFAAHTAPPPPRRRRRRRFGLFGTQTVLWTLAAVSMWSEYVDAQGRKLCGLPTARGGRCRNLAATCPDRAAGRHRQKHAPLVAEALAYDLPSLSRQRTAVRQADWLNPPNSVAHGPMKAARTLASADAGILPSGGPAAAGLHRRIVDFLEQRPDGFTFDPGDPFDPADPAGGPLDGVCVTLDNTKLQWSAAQAEQLFPDGKADAAARALLRNWVNTVSGVLNDGRCWIGGWRNAAGAVEVNVTFVFRPEHETAAREFGALQGQEAVHRLLDHKDLATHGTGGSGADHAVAAQRHVERAAGRSRRRDRAAAPDAAGT